MFNVVIYGILLFILVMLIWITYHFKYLADNSNDPADPVTDPGRSRLLGSHNFIYAAIVLVILSILVFTYLIVKGSPMEGHVMEWLNIVVRVMHITFGIAWIGASFYFVFLENALNRTGSRRLQGCFLQK